MKSEHFTICVITEQKGENVIFFPFFKLKGFFPPIEMVKEYQIMAWQGTLLKENH